MTGVKRYRITKRHLNNGASCGIIKIGGLYLYTKALG